jgi:hypothetical protein
MAESLQLHAYRVQTLELYDIFESGLNQARCNHRKSQFNTDKVTYVTSEPGYYQERMKRNVALQWLAYIVAQLILSQEQATHFSLSYIQHIRSERNTHTDFTKPVQKVPNCSAPTDEQQDCELLNSVNWALNKYITEYVFGFALFRGAQLLLGVVFGHFVVSWTTGFPTWSFWIIFKLELHHRAMTDLLTAWQSV